MRPPFRSLARDARTSVLVTTLLVVVITVLVIAVPVLHFAYRSLVAHAAMETAATVIASIAAALSFVRARRTCALTDVLLFGTLSLLTITNLFFSLAPALADAASGPFATWAPVAGRFLGGLGFLAAAFAGTRKVSAADRACRQILAAAVAITAVIALSVAALEPTLPAGVEVEASPEDSGRPTLDGTLLVLALQLGMVVVYAGAALGFLRNAERGVEGAHAWLAVAMVVAAGSRLHYFLYPSLYSEYVYVGDFLRVGFYAVLLGGTIAEIFGYERRMAALAVFEERRRMARDLHDGLAQELAFIKARARTDGNTEEIRRAADRALTESRHAITALMRPSDEPLSEALARAAVEASRGKAEVEVEAAEDADASPAAREALLRIVGEAVTNATRHGRAQRIKVALERNGALYLRVRDDGRGFDPEAPVRADAYGLITMRERAQAVGGSLTVSATAGEGVLVEVRVP